MLDAEQYDDDELMSWAEDDRVYRMPTRVPVHPLRSTYPLTTTHPISYQQQSNPRQLSKTATKVRAARNSTSGNAMTL
jgi:hypothetical protein